MTPTGPIHQAAPDPVGVLLDTGYWQFRSLNGVGGLAKWTEERLDLLAVHSDRQGQGQFRDFITDCKLRWKTVCVWEDWNPLIGEALARYGFIRATETQPDGEVITGWRWDAKEAP